MQARIAITPKATRLDRLHRQRRLLEMSLEASRDHRTAGDSFQADYLSDLIEEIDALIAEVEA